MPCTAGRIVDITGFTVAIAVRATVIAARGWLTALAEVQVSITASTGDCYAEVACTSRDVLCVAGPCA